MQLISLILLTGVLQFHVAAYVDNCRPDQHYDNQIQDCLDRCGDDNEVICPVDEYCSSNTEWSDEYDPPKCLKRCVHECVPTSYCDHVTSECRPCDTLCGGSNMDACRAYCYDIYIMLPPTTPQVQGKICNDNQYYDNHREVCLDRCGVNNEYQCSVDEFCSASVPWGEEIDPPVCLNHCQHSCHSPSYCDRITQTCLPCANLCDGANVDLCRIHCLDIFLDSSLLEPQHSTGVAGTTEQNIIDSLKLANTTNTLYAIILPTLYVTVIVIGICVAIFLVLKLCGRKRKSTEPANPTGAESKLLDK